MQFKRPACVCDCQRAACVGVERHGENVKPADIAQVDRRRRLVGGKTHCEQFARHRMCVDRLNAHYGGAAGCVRNCAQVGRAVDGPGKSLDAHQVKRRPGRVDHQQVIIRVHGKAQGFEITAKIAADRCRGCHVVTDEQSVVEKVIVKDREELAVLVGRQPCQVT